MLVLDEAHWLTVPLFFNILRRLLHCVMDTTAPFALMLTGHTELRQKRAFRPLEAMRQRVTLAYYLRPLTREALAASVLVGFPHLLDQREPTVLHKFGGPCGNGHEWRNVLGGVGVAEGSQIVLACLRRIEGRRVARLH